MSDDEALFIERLPARCARMRTELVDEQVPILGAVAQPDSLARDPHIVDQILLEELVYARHVPVHEGHRPPYGSLIVPEVQSLKEYLRGEPINVPTPAALRALRPLVDGARTVLVRDVSGTAAVATLDVADELDLVDTLRRFGGIGIQRLPDHRIRVAVRSGVALSSEGDWSFRPLSGAVVKALAAELMLPGDDRVQRMQELGSLLEFCFHRLSPNGIGATLVLSLDSAPDQLLDGVSDIGIEPVLPLNVFARRDQGLFRNVLASVDGACLVTREGNLARFQMKLRSTETAQSVVREHGGTRHTSAKRFSYDKPGAVVVVVSADGPVTLFAAGMAISQDTQLGEPWTMSTESEVRTRAREDHLRITCGGCSTEYTCHVVIDDEGGAVVQFECRVCGELTHVHDHVLAQRIRAVRPWE